ncbi:MAG: ABC transporter substrate-binding protein [Rhodospirillales bacterium]|nr:ABC transporter substrate-binding protein [Rhodospirillales bacterium]
MRKIIIHISFLILTFIAPAHAESFYGLATHGTPKYGPDFDHLSYVNPDAPKGGTLKQARIGTFDTLNPFSIKGKADDGLALFYDRLMARVWDEPFTLYPLIAESVDIPEDRSALTVHINPAARFHNGNPITADDVLFSFETLKEKGRPNMRQIYRLVETIEKIDDHTVKMTFGEGYNRETVMILAMMPVLSKAYWTGRDFEETTLDTPVGSGPYRIAEVDPGRKLVLERVPDYWAANLPVNRGQFNFDRLVFDYYRDDTVAFESFKAGEYDLRRENDIAQWVSAYDFTAVQNGAVKTQSFPHARPEKVRSLIFNTRRAPFDDIRVRKALTLALDFDWINKTLFHGHFKRITSYYPNSELAAHGQPSAGETALLGPWKDQLPEDVFGPSWTPPASDVRQNLKTADALLKEAGWTIENGRRVKNGQPFSFEILLNAPEEEKIALAFIRSLKRLGIDAHVRVLDSAAYRGRLNDYDFDMTLYYWWNSLSPGTEQMLYWSCAAANQPARWNFAGICNPAVDALAQDIADAKDRADLVAHAHALDRVLMAGHYMIPLYYAGEDDIAYRAFLHHPETIPIYGPVLETWWTDNIMGNK